MMPCILRAYVRSHQRAFRGDTERQTAWYAEGSACLDHTFCHTVRTLCEETDDITSHYLKEENDKYGDDNTVHTSIQ